jgi:hypothetical protein
VSADISQLFSLLENELSVGEGLTQNLKAQKQAILDWDIVKLLEEINVRESWLRSMRELEEKRCEIIRRVSPPNSAMTLRQIIATLPEEPKRVSFDQLRERMRKVFTSLELEERKLHELMEGLLAHIQEGLNVLAPTAVPVYSENGIPPSSYNKSSLLHGKA